MVAVRSSQRKKVVPLHHLPTYLIKIVKLANYRLDLCLIFTNLHQYMISKENHGVTEIVKIFIITIFNIFYLQILQNY